MNHYYSINYFLAEEQEVKFQTDQPIFGGQVFDPSNEFENDIIPAGHSFKVQLEIAGKLGAIEVMDNKVGHIEHVDALDKVFEFKVNTDSLLINLNNYCQVFYQYVLTLIKHKNSFQLEGEFLEQLKKIIMKLYTARMKEILNLSYHPIADNVYFHSKLENFEKKLFEIGKQSFLEMEKLIEKQRNADSRKQINGVKKRVEID